MSRSNEQPPPPIAPAGLGATVIRGMVVGTIGLSIGKFSSLLQTLALGWIFSNREFGAYGAAISAAMIGDVLTDGGLRRVLITRGPEYARLARTAFGVALGFNLLGCLLMSTAALGYRRQHPEAVGPLIVTGIALALSTLGTIQKCKQSIDLRFGQIALMGTLSSVLRNGLTVAFAWLFMSGLHRPDLAPLAFALPLIGVNLWEATYVRRTVGPLPASAFDAGLARELIGQGRWVIFAYLGGALIYRGDYLVATWTLDRGVVGQYVFGFQLAVALFSPLSIGMASIIQPVMARLRADPLRQAGAFARMVRIGVLLATAGSLAAVLVTPLLIHALWPGRPEWHACVPVVQLIAATECVRQVHAMCLATLDGRGEWRRSAVLIAIDGVLTVVAALVGCAIGSLLALALAVAIERTLLAIAQAIYTARRTEGSARVILAQLLPPLAIAGPLALVAMLAVGRLGVTSDVARLLLASATLPALAAYAGLCRIFTPARFNEAVELLLSRVRRPRGPTSI